VRLLQDITAVEEGTVGAIVAVVAVSILVVVLKAAGSDSVFRGAPETGLMRYAAVAAPNLDGESVVISTQVDMALAGSSAARAAHLQMEQAPHDTIEVVALLAPNGRWRSLGYALPVKPPDPLKDLETAGN
jgi:hypothetical protein